MMGLPAGNDRPAVWFQRVHPEDLPALQRQFQAHLDGVKPRFKGEFRLREAPGGRQIWISARGLAIRGGDGNTSRVMLLGLFGDADTIEVENRFGGPFGKPLPQNAELYMVRGESRYGVNPMPNFKVSNSVVMGTMPNPSVTLARNWTAAEAAAFSQPFKAHLNPNANMHLGKDTEIAGDAKGGAPQR